MRSKPLPTPEALTARWIEDHQHSVTSRKPSDDLSGTLSTMLAILMSEGNAPKSMEAVARQTLLELAPDMEEAEIPHAIPTLRIKVSRFLKSLSLPAGRHLIESQVDETGTIRVKVDETMAEELVKIGPSHYGSPYTTLNQDHEMEKETHRTLKSKLALALAAEINERLATMGDEGEQQEPFSKEEISYMTMLIEKLLNTNEITDTTLPRPMQRWIRSLRSTIQDNKGILAFKKDSIHWGKAALAHFKAVRKEFWDEFEATHHEALWTWAQREQRPFLLMMDRLEFETRNEREEDLKGIEILWAGDQTHRKDLPDWITSDRTPIRLRTTFGTIDSHIKHEALAALIEREFLSEAIQSATTIDRRTAHR